LHKPFIAAIEKVYTPRPVKSSRDAVNPGHRRLLLIDKISLNSQEFSRKTNHEDANKAHKGGMKQRFIPSFCAFVFSNRRFVGGSKFFNVLINSSPWKLNADALPVNPGKPARGQKRDWRARSGALSYFRLE
jgi:hypothetical protein